LYPTVHCLFFIAFGVQKVYILGSGRFWSPMPIQLQNFITNSTKLQKIWIRCQFHLSSKENLLLNIFRFTKIQFQALRWSIYGHPTLIHFFMVSMSTSLQGLHSRNLIHIYDPNFSFPLSSILWKFNLVNFGESFALLKYVNLLLPKLVIWMLERGV